MLKFAILLLAAIAMASALTGQEKFSEFKVTVFFYLLKNVYWIFIFVPC